MKAQEKWILGTFVTLVILWFFRTPQFITGWGEYVYILKQARKSIPKKLYTNR